MSEKINVDLKINKSKKTQDYYMSVGDINLQDPKYPKEKVLEEFYTKRYNDNVNIYILFGLNFGYTIEALKVIKPDSVIFVYEPENIIKEEVFKYRYKKLKNLKEIFISSDIQDIVKKLYNKRKLNEFVEIIPHKKWVTFFPEEYKNFIYKVKTTIKNTNISEITKSVRYRPWIENLIKNLSMYVNTPHPVFLMNKFKNNKAIIVSPGPSLEKNIDLLKDKDLQKHSLIIAVSKAYSILLNRGIKPHILVNIESVDTSFMYENIDKNTILFSPLIVNPDILKLPFKNKIIYAHRPSIYENLLVKNFKEPLTIELGGNVSCGAFAIAMMLGVNTIVLLGQDLSFHKNEKGKIIEYSNSKIKKDIVISKDNKNIFIPVKKDVSCYKNLDYLSTELDYIKGFYGGEVLTNDIYKFGLSWFTSIADLLKKSKRKTNCINATEGGAYIEGFDHISFEKAIKTHNLKGGEEHKVIEKVEKINPIKHYKKSYETFIKDTYEKLNIFKNREDLLREVPLLKEYLRGIKDEKKYIEKFKNLIYHQLSNFL